MPGQGAENIQLNWAFQPQDSAAATITGDAIDRASFASMVMSHRCGTASGTPTSYTVDTKLQESDASGSGFADVAGETLVQLTADNTSDEKVVDLRGRKRYLKLVTTVAFVGGTSPKVEAAGAVVLCDPVVKPAVES
jgi:hypothetical protein